MSLWIFLASNTKLFALEIVEGNNAFLSYFNLGDKSFACFM